MIITRIKYYRRQPTFFMTNTIMTAILFAHKALLGRFLHPYFSLKKKGYSSKKQNVVDRS